jgi:hypothetical protein
MILPFFDLPIVKEVIKRAIIFRYTRRDATYTATISSAYTGLQIQRVE